MLQKFNACKFREHIFKISLRNDTDTCHSALKVNKRISLSEGYVHMYKLVKIIP